MRTQVWRVVTTLAISAGFFLPLYVALISVFKRSAEIVDSPLALPTPPTIENISKVLSRPDGLYWNGLINSLVLTSSSLIITTLLAAMSAHYLVRSGKAWGKAFLGLMLVGLMVPPSVIMLPITRLLSAIGLMGTMPGAILVNVGYYLPFAVFVFSGFVRAIPRELEEAAAVDGASPMRAFWSIVFPLLRPATASVAIFLGVWVWNDFLTPLLVLGPGSGNTVTVGIFRSIGPYQQDYGAVFAFMFLATIPVLIFYLAFQRHFVRGLTGGASKG